MNIKLKQTLSIHSEPAYIVADKVGRSPAWLSMVIREMAEPSELEKRKISEVLGRRVGELFPAHNQEVA